MKRMGITLFFLLAGMSVFAQSGVITELTGTVELKTPRAADYVAAKPGDRVNQDTIVSTGFKSTALIQVGNTTIAVRPLTRLTLTEISAASESETLNLNLQAGRVRVDVKPPAGSKANATVQGPSVTASVRGTSFYFDGRNISVSDGTVELHGKRGNPVSVPAGSISGIIGNEKAANAVHTGVGKNEASFIVITIDDGLLPPAPGGGIDSLTGDSISGGGESHSSGDLPVVIEY